MSRADSGAVGRWLLLVIRVVAKIRSLNLLVDTLCHFVEPGSLERERRYYGGLLWGTKPETVSCAEVRFQISVE